MIHSNRVPVIISTDVLMLVTRDTLTRKEKHNGFPPDNHTFHLPFYEVVRVEIHWNTDRRYVPLRNYIGPLTEEEFLQWRLRTVMARCQTLTEALTHLQTLESLRQ